MRTKPPEKDAENGLGSTLPDDAPPTAPSNPITRARILTSGYIAGHPTLLSVLEWLGWHNPGGSINP